MEQSGEHILIGNLGCNGHQIDAVFIAAGQITVIDFKDYEGDLTFSENNPWRMTTPEREVVFVQGGARARNPFQQVRAYRFSLTDFLKENESSILEGIRNDINWYHVGCLILFQRPVKFDNNTLPATISRYFQVHDTNTIYNALIDKHSRGLELSDSEIGKITKLLDVGDENLLLNFDFKEENSNFNRVSEEKLNLIRRLMRDTTRGDRYSNVLTYYKVLINAERYKEPTASNLHQFPFDVKQDLSQYYIDLTCSSEFHNVFLQDRQQRFPKNLFIALNVLVDGVGYPLLQTSILASDIESNDGVQVDINNLDLYVAALERMGLTEDVVEELSTAVNSVNTLEDKVQKIRELLEVSAELTSYISIGLSQESMYSVQLQSELNSLSKKNIEYGDSSIFKDFILNKKINYSPDQHERYPLISITSLNPSQIRAVELAFENPLTVVTGPPGTGKSQVVLNILANAIHNKQSVLFVSKNNKAINTVKERIDNLLVEDYLIRTGSQNEISQNTKNTINSFLSRKSQGVFPDEQEQLDQRSNDFQDLINRVDLLKTRINQIPLLQLEVQTLEADLHKQESLHQDWLESQSKIHRELFLDKQVQVDADTNEVGLTIHQIDKWNSNWFSRIWFDWFEKESFRQQLKLTYDEQDITIKELIDVNAPYIQPNCSILNSAKNFLVYLLELKNKAAKITSTDKEFEHKTKTADSILQKQKAQLNTLISRKKEFEAEINSITDSYPSIGLELLNLSVNQRLNKLNPANCRQYVDYLPVKNIYRDQDVQDFKVTTKLFLNDFNAVCLTNLSVKNSFPLVRDLFDILVIDEASQCDIASALPLIYRAKKVVVIGDPLQLKHITSVKDYEENYLLEKLELEGLQLNYVENSLYDYCYKLANKSQLESVFLKEHYRCHPQIISFSNHQFYERKLGQTMSIKTEDSHFKFGNKGIHWINVEGQMRQDKNLNVTEVNKCLDLAIELTTNNPDATIGIITPFRHQYEEIFKKIPDDYRERIQIDTVHKYQGDEKDIIILSTVVTHNSTPGKAGFINRNDFLINVAVTRAKNSLYIVGNFNYCKGLIEGGKAITPLAALARYVEQEDRVKI